MKTSYYSYMESKRLEKQADLEILKKEDRIVYVCLGIFALLIAINLIRSIWYMNA